MVHVSSSGNVGVGTTTPGSYKLAVKGVIRANEVIVDTGWSNYVFDENYTLPSLSLIEANIKAEKHLPGIPPAAEAAKRGVSIGEIQAMILAKVEELTLHAIAQQQEIEQLKRENARLASAVSAGLR
jgi:hypothetical protein